MTKRELKEFVKALDGYGLVVTDEELLNETIDSIPFEE